MVKKAIIIFFVLNFISCNKKNNYIFVKDNSNLIYWNFKDESSIELAHNTTTENMIFSKFDVNNAYPNNKLLRNQHQLLKVFHDASNNHFKQIVSKEQLKYLELKYDSTNSNTKVFLIGKQKFVPNIDSYLFLVYDTIYNKKTSNKSIVLFNFKHTKLRSVTTLSSLIHGIDDVYTMNSYYSEGMFSIMQEDYPMYLSLELYTDLKIKTEDFNFKRLSQFSIDKDGYILLR